MSNKLEDYDKFDEFGFYNPFFSSDNKDDDEELDFVQPKKIVNKLISINVLDKIRAEIEQIVNEEQKHDKKWAIGLRYAVNIIDKYKAESEDKE